MSTDEETEAQKFTPTWPFSEASQTELLCGETSATLLPQPREGPQVFGT
jgi:hypothetical protein